MYGNQGYGNQGYDMYGNQPQNNGGYQYSQVPGQNYGQQQQLVGNQGYGQQQQQYQNSYPQQVPQQVLNQEMPQSNNWNNHGKMTTLESLEVSDTMKFVRKVYTILAIQLTVTASWVALVQTNESTRKWVDLHSELYIVAIVGSIGLMCAILCCFGRQHPTNLILLGLFTLCESYMVAGITSQYSDHVVIMAALATALVTIALTVYAMRTKTEIQVFVAMAFVVYMAMFPLMIISFIIQLKALHILYCCLGLIFYSLYLIIDTIVICGKEKHNGIEMDKNDYVIGAMMLYLDIIMIFIYILRLLGESR